MSALDLVVDLGNTRSHLALIDAARAIVAATDVPHEPAAAREALWSVFLGERRPARIALVSVNPPARAALDAWLAGRGLAARAFGEPSLPVPIPLDVDGPARVGPDRLADAVWAAREHPGRVVLVADLGTAITLNVVSARGAFVGGAIAPGLGTGAWALHARTAKLPRVELPPASASAALGIGKDTTACIQAGLLAGAVGLVTTYAERIEALLGARPIVVATGGDAALVAAHCPRIERVVPHLTLLGVHRALAGT